MVPRVAHVASRRYEGADTWTLDLDLPGGMDYAPGQFNMLYAFGVGEAAISMSGDPADRSRLTHTIRAVGETSAALTRLDVGDAIGVRGPFGASWPMQEAEGRDVVVVAGGLGLAPLRPALYRFLAERQRYGKLSLLFGTRSPDDILFRAELEEWRRRLDVDIEVTVDRATAEWHGHVGVVTTLVRRADFDPARAIALVCGPEVDDALFGNGAEGGGDRGRSDLSLHGAQYEMRHWFLRPLPVRPGFHLQGRSGLQL